MEYKLLRKFATIRRGAILFSGVAALLLATKVNAQVPDDGGNTTLLRLDGGYSNYYQAGNNLDLPFPDAAIQFSVKSTVPGEHAGSIVNVVTRSETDQYHGSGYEFNRNKLFGFFGYH
jgi:hypothetical protein